VPASTKAPLAKEFVSTESAHVIVPLASGVRAMQGRKSRCDNFTRRPDAPSLTCLCALGQSHFNTHTSIMYQVWVRPSAAPQRRPDGPDAALGAG